MTEQKPPKFLRQRTISFSLTGADIEKIEVFVDRLRARGVKANRSRAVQEMIRSCVQEAKP